MKISVLANIFSTTLKKKKFKLCCLCLSDVRFCKLKSMSFLNKPFLSLCLRISSGGPLAVAVCGWGAVKKKKNLRALKDKAERETAQTMRKPGAHCPRCS